MNVAIGGGVSLSFFDFSHVPRLRRRAPQGVGDIMHIAIPAPAAHVAAVKTRLDAECVPYQDIGGSLYFNDPNGLGLELMLAE